MARCERCQDTVPHVWRHRDYGETMTHRPLRWLCADCHPSMSGVVANDLSSEVLMADGGTSACPECSGPTVDGQGPFDCVECGWSGTR